MLVDLALILSLAKLSPGFSTTRVVRQSSKEEKKKKLHGTNMSVNEDYSDRVIKRRTQLLPKLKDARTKEQS